MVGVGPAARCGVMPPVARYLTAWPLGERQSVANIEGALANSGLPPFHGSLSIAEAELLRGKRKELRDRNLQGSAFRTEG